MTIYTRTGDKGKTGLFSGERVAKDDERIEAYGSVDELNSILGALAAALPPERHDLVHTLQGIQADLFAAGAWMAITPGSPSAKQLAPLEAGRVEALEAGIDALQETLPPLTRFILPGGHASAAWAHVARSVCRRAERQAVRLFSHGHEAYAAGVYGEILRYLNRLSDYLFVVARYCNAIQGEKDVEWQGTSG